ncbi:MAG: hypothetical protein H7Z73_09170 [Candidatus Saccharibacteria bacterium]|nr:hypothetical protein [Moraxellaceae bacterium]
MYSLLSFLQSIPNVIWSGVGAAVIALSGVLVSNWGNTNRLKVQLGHDANERAKERTSTLRRDVYLVAAAELTKVGSRLASLPQKPLSKEKSENDLNDFFASTSKLQLVAEPQTALLVNRLAGEYAELHLKLLVKTIPINQACCDINLFDDMHEKANNEVTRIIAEKFKFTETAQTNDAIFKALQSSFEFQSSQSQEFSNKRSEAWNLYNRLNVEFISYLLIELRRLGEMQIPVLIAIRKDLGLTSELSALQAQMQEYQERISLQFDRLINTIKEDQ